MNWLLSLWLYNICIAKYKDKLKYMHIRTCDYASEFPQFEFEFEFFSYVYFILFSYFCS